MECGIVNSTVNPKTHRDTQHSFVVKYQPSTINDFQQLGTVFKNTVTSLIEINSLNILITGSPGVGKSSLITAIIREYYGPLYNEENILALNSLKEQGIQYYRNDLKVFSQTNSLIKNKKKIILLDDVDLINEQSQQVFRNCIDKYSNNVHFIMSCTNLQKVIDSLQSRHIILNVPAPTVDTMYQIANHIIREEPTIALIDAEALSHIITLSNLTIRLLVNYIEKIYILNVPLTVKIAKMIYTNICVKDFEQFTASLITGDMANALKLLYDMHEHGYSVIDIFENYFAFIKSTEDGLLDEMQKYKIISLLCKYITVFYNVHEDEIELALFTNNAICALRSNEIGY